MKKFPQPDNEAKRLEALQYYNVLDTEKEEAFDRLAELAALICETPIALVSLIDESRQWFKANVGLEDVAETGRDISFCQFTIMGNETFEVPDATKDERFVDNPLVTGSPDIRFYAGYPLTDPNGNNLGSFCVIDKKPKKLNDTQLKALEVLAQEVVSQIIARKEYQERIKLEKLFNYSTDFICIADKEGSFKKINPSFKNVLGYDEEELLKSRIIDFVHEEDLERTTQELNKLTAGEKAIHFQNRYRKKNGEYIILDWFSNTDSSSEEVYTIARDVTDKVKILKELEEAKVIAEKAVKVKDEFLSNMSHEIRTPLNAIIGFNELLRQSSLTLEQEKHADIVRVASQNLMVIINDILDISKLESGKLELEKRPFSLKEMAEDIIHLQSQKAKNKGLKLLLSVDQDIPNFVLGDSTRISQVLINLIGNSIKFTTQGYVELKIMELHRKNHLSTVRFSVKDTGIGIRKDKHHLVFERFSQAENSTTRVFGGTGLGLNIVKMILNMYGSTIDLQSEEGKGSEFTFELELPIAENGEMKQENRSVPVVENAELKLKGLSILVVEDNEHNQILATTYLKNSGASVDLANNGQIAVEKVKSKQYDIILMDLQMPVMDGLAATKIIREELKLDIPIVACSAHSLIGERENCMGQGMDDYISKPYSPATLVNVLSACIAQKSQLSTVPSNEVEHREIVTDDFKTILSNIEQEYGKEFLDTMLEVYQRRIPTDIAALEKALKEKDTITLQTKAHLLAGSLSSLHFKIGYDLAKELENETKLNNSETLATKTQHLIDYLKKSLEIFD